jgi:hypothetical protein
MMGNASENLSVLKREAGETVPLQIANGVSDDVELPESIAPEKIP